MKNPVGLELSVQSRSRWARLIVASVALSVGVTAWAQTYGVSTYAGAALAAGNTDTATGPATGARFNTPKGVAVDSAGNLYVADAVNSSVRKIAATTGITSTIGTGLLNPSGVAVDSLGNVYVADTGHHRIAKIVGTTVTILAGDAAAGASGLIDNATGTSARFFNPSGIAVNSGGTLLYVADTGNHVIRRIDLSGTVGVTTIAGTVTGGAGTAGAVNGTPGTVASFNIPYALALNATGTLLFVADRNNHSIRQIDLTASNAVSTFAGTSGTSGSTDAPALFKNPEGVAIDAGGILYVSDSGNATVRKITSAGGVSTLAGSPGLLGVTDGLSTSARFQEPFGIAVNSSGVIYVADASSQNIRRLAVASAPGVTTPVNPSTPGLNTVATGGTISFATTFSGSPAPTIQWQVQPAVGGGFTPLTVATPYSVVTTSTTSTLTITGAPATLSGNQYRVAAVNGVVPDATSAAVTLIVNQPPTMANATTTANFTVNTTSTFTFTATGSPVPTLSILSGNYPTTAALTQVQSGSTTTGTITWAPSTSEASGSPYVFTVKATNASGTDATQTFTFTVLTGPTIVTQPYSQTVSPYQNAQFTVTATSNGGNLTYQWQRQQAGTFGFFNLVDSGLYYGTNTASLTVVSSTQSTSGDQFQVVVSSGIGTPVTSTPVTLTVTQPPQITSLNSASFVEDQYGTFSIQATGSPAPTYTLTSGSLPYGLSLNSSTGAISGYAQAGTSALSPYYLQVTATNGVNPGAVQNLILTVTPTALMPAFTTQPTSLTVALGQTATFTVVVTGNPTPTIQWQRLAVNYGVFVDLVNDATFSGVNSTTLTITNPTSGMSGDYFRANATNSSGTTPSSSATLTLVIGTTISTFAGQATIPGSTDAAGLSARFNGPAGIAVDSYGNLYVADSSNHVIRKITTAGVVTTLAGTAGVSGSADGMGSAARFNAPSGVAVTGLGTVYVADTYNHTIRVISPDGVVTTLAGLAGSSGSADGTGNLARFLYPYGLAVDAGGTVYVADTFNHTIRRIQSGGFVSTYAGTAGARGTVNSYGVAARFAFPFALALDSSGNLYVADSYNHAIRKIDTVANVSTLAGNPGLPGTFDGTGTGALFNQPSGVAVGPAGNIYVADTYNHTIRRVTIGGRDHAGRLGGFPGLVRRRGQRRALQSAVRHRGRLHGQYLRRRYAQPHDSPQRQCHGPDDHHAAAVDRRGPRRHGDLHGRGFRRADAVHLHLAAPAGQHLRVYRPRG